MLFLALVRREDDGCFFSSLEGVNCANIIPSTYALTEISNCELPLVPGLLPCNALVGGLLPPVKPVGSTAHLDHIPRQQPRNEAGQDF